MRETDRDVSILHSYKTSRKLSFKIKKGRYLNKLQRIVNIQLYSK